MTVNLSYFAGAGFQYFDNNGIPLSGGLIYSYSAGTTTPVATYTSSSGTVANSNPIVLDSSGRVPYEIWATPGVNYKFVLQNASGTQIGSWDNLPVINDTTAISTTLTNFENSLASASGSTLVGFEQGNNAGYYTGAVAQTVGLKLNSTVSVFDFMTTAQITAVQTNTYSGGVTDVSAPIQNALNTGNLIYFPPGTYQIATTIRFQNIGQIIQGAGHGYAGEIARTVIKWTGSSGGVMLSNRASATGAEIGSCQLKDLALEGNSLAGIGWQVYDNSDSTGGGNWRNCAYNVNIQNVTQGSGIGIELGHSNSAPNFANDFFMVGCGIYGCKIGAYGNGAIYNFYNTTMSSNTTTAIYGEQGSNWGLYGCILSSNATDFTVHNVQLLTMHGGWCENSTNGILTTVSGSTQGSYNFNGVFLYTSSSSQLMALGSVAGGTSIVGCFVPSSSVSNLITGINPLYPFSTIGSTNVAFGISPGINAGETGIGNCVVGNTGTGQLFSGGASNVANGGTYTLPFVISNQTFIGFMVVGSVKYGAGNTRTTTTYSVFYYQGDNTTTTQIATATGSAGGNTFSVGFSSSGVTLTNTSGFASDLFVSMYGSAMF